ncbi:MAG TPA: hypothetical protein VGC79_13780 [Polyangiaceae bacterium]
MGRHFDVVGDDGGDVEGADVMGDVMGDFTSDYEGGAQVVGYTDEGYPVVAGKGRRRRGPQVQLTQPGWRRGQLAPGVIAPDQGLLPLPMGSFTYNLGNQINTFQGQLQKPFRGERLLVSVVRTGTTAVGRIMGQIFVGSDLAALDVPALDIQQIGDPTAFGVRLTMKPAQPGVFIRIVTSLSSALTTTDTIFATVTLLGRLIH